MRTLRDEEKCLDVVIDDKQGVSRTNKLCRSPTTNFVDSTCAKTFFPTKKKVQNPKYRKELVNNISKSSSPVSKKNPAGESLNLPFSWLRDKHAENSILHIVKSTSASSSTVTTTTTEITFNLRRKKFYSLDGQKFDPPKEGDPSRIFYESLSKQIPTSEMAEFWLMERGLLSPEAATKAYFKKYWKQKQRMMTTSIKSLPPSSSPKKPQPMKNYDVNGTIGLSKKDSLSTTIRVAKNFDQNEAATVARPSDDRSKYEDKEEQSTSK